MMSFNPILRSHWIYTDYFADIGWADDQREYTARSEHPKDDLQR